MSFRQLARISNVARPSLITSRFDSNIVERLLCNQNILLTRGIHDLPVLPFELETGLKPAMSAKTASLVYSGYLKKSVDSLNEMTEGTDFAKMSLIDVIKVASRNLDTRILYNTASQIWNCNFCLASLTQKSTPGKDMEMQLSSNFGTYDNFVKELHTQADAMFGGGFIWLVKSTSSGLKVIVTPNAESPIYPFLPTQPSKEPSLNDSNLTPDKANITGLTNPILGINLWGYSYILDHGLNKHAYLDGILSNVDWAVVYERYLRDYSTSKLSSKGF